MSHIWYCYQQQGACFNINDFSIHLFFFFLLSLHAAKFIAGESQSCCALSEVEDASNLASQGTKHLAPLSTGSGKAGCQGKQAEQCS